MEDLTIMAHGMPEDKKDNVWLGRGKCFGLEPPAFPHSINGAYGFTNY